MKIGKKRQFWWKKAKKNEKNMWRKLKLNS